MMHAGKEFSSQHYNVKKLKAQGVKFEEIDESDVSTL